MDAILDDPEKRSQFADQVGWDKLGPWRSVGGVRIEDNALIKDGAPEVVTAAIPK